jgi:hypothetical protein
MAIIVEKALYTFKIFPFYSVYLLPGQFTCTQQDKIVCGTQLQIFGSSTNVKNPSHQPVGKYVLFTQECVVWITTLEDITHFICFNPFIS